MSLEYDPKALAEVYYVITFLDDVTYNKIPLRIINYIKKNMDKKIVISEDMIKEENILPDAQELLSLIYTEYLYDESSDGPIFDESEEIISRERQAVNRLEEKTNLNINQKNRTKDKDRDYSNNKKKNRKDRRNRKKGFLKKEKNENQEKNDYSLILKKESLFEKIIKNINKVIQNIFP